MAQARIGGIGGIVVAALTVGAVAAVQAQGEDASSSAMPYAIPGEAILMGVESPSLGDCQTLRVLASDGGASHDIPGECIGQAHARWGPSGTRVLLDRDSGGRRGIVAIDVASGAVEQLTDGTYWDWGPAVSPDGTTIAFDRADDERGLGIHLMDDDGSSVRQLTVPPPAPDPRDDTPEFRPNDMGATFSPDGSQVAFTRVLSFNTARLQAALFVADVAGGEPRQLTPWNVGPEWPTWSPDGSRILYTSGSLQGATAPLAMWTVRPDGTDATRVVPQGEGWSISERVGEGDWSPDGSRILFKRYSDGLDHNELWTANADGSETSLLLAMPSDMFAETPDWAAFHDR